MTIIRLGMSLSDYAASRRAWAFGADGGAVACVTSIQKFHSRAAIGNHFAFGLESLSRTMSATCLSRIACSLATTSGC